MRSIYIYCLLGLFFLSGIKLYAYDFQSGSIYYNIINDNSVEVTNGDAKYEGDIVIPEKISNNGKNYNVTRIRDSAFYGCSGLTSIMIPNSVTSIGNKAFYGCSGLTSISIPNSVTSIGDGAFISCRNLISITIPSSVSSIGTEMLNMCIGLTSIKVESGNNVYDSRNNSNAIIKTSTNELIYGCKNTIIQNSVMGIGDCAFFGCSSLSSITIPNSVMSIGDHAFRYSGLTSISIPNSVTSIGNNAFEGCSGLTSISIPNSVTSIGSGAFWGCSMSSITIPNSVTSIGEDAFSNCLGLSSINVESRNKKFDSRNNCNAIIETSSNTLIAGCKNTSIPSSVTSIGSGAFWGCSMSSITIPNSVTSIGNSAFLDCSGLKSITIPSSITSIDKYAFAYCYGLTSIISEIVKPFEISKDVFSDYSKPTLTVPSGTKSAYQSTAGWNKFTNIVESTNSSDNTGSKRTIHVATAGTLPNLISESEKYSIEELTLTGELNGTDFRLLRDMAGCNYREEETDGKLTVLDFSGTKIVAGGDNYVDTYGGWGWWGGLHYTVNDNDMLPQYVFYGCKFTSLKIPNSVTSIGNYAFMDCTCLTSITIPSLVTSIGDMAFSGCSGLTSIVSEIVKPFVISEGVFSDYSTPTLTVPSGTKSAYQSTAGWNKFTNIVEASGDNTSTKRTIHVATAGTLSDLISESEKYTIEELTLTGELNGTDFRLLRDMAGCDYMGEDTQGKLKVLNMSGARIVKGGEKYLDADHLPGWSGSTHFSYTIEESDKLPQHIFHGCKFTAFMIPNTVTNIEEDAFDSCNDLRSVSIPNSVVFIGRSAFQNCKNLETIKIPSSVLEIEPLAFYFCCGLTSIEVESGNNYYDSRNNCNAIIETSTNSLFVGCRNTIIPNTITSIWWSAFEGCSELASITIPNSITNIGDYAFAYCNSLTSIIIPSSMVSLADHVFYDCTALSSITVPNDLAEIGSEAFGNTAWFNNQPDGLVYAGKVAYRYKGATPMNTSLTIEDGTLGIAGMAFYDCRGLISVTIPNSVMVIGESAFHDCSGLTSISIPNSVRSIGNYAFYGCSNLTSIVSELMMPFTINETVFSDYSTPLLTVPSGTKSTYQSTAGWNKFVNIVETNSNIDAWLKEIQEMKNTGYGLQGIWSKVVSESERISNIEEQNFASLYKGLLSEISYLSNHLDYVEKRIGEGTMTEEDMQILREECERISKAVDEMWQLYDDARSNIVQSVFQCNEGGVIKLGAYKKIENQQETIKWTTIEELKFSIDVIPNDGYSIKSIQVNGTPVSGTTFSSTDINGDFMVQFEKNAPSQVSFTDQGISYQGTTSTLKAEVRSVNDDKVVIPATVSYDGSTYDVTSVADGVLSNRTFDYVSLPSTITSLESGAFSNSTLGALIWNANTALPSNVISNMAMPTSANFLLYVNKKEFAPSNVNNVVVGNTASSITLKDGIDTKFYCPKSFTAQTISYTHHYGMTTGGNGKGWETIALPFDVQRIEHKTKGVITPFASYQSGSDQRPFWLCELGSNGFKRTASIKANTPYIIAMPNSSNYDEKYNLAGDVTFSATNVTVAETASLTTSTSKDKTFIPAFAVKDKASSVYALNVSNELVSNSSANGGSEFVSDLRSVYPFEAYMTTSSSAARSLSIVFDDGTTGIDEIPQREQKTGIVKVYNLTGMLLLSVPQGDFTEKWQSLPSGVYIVNGQKMIKTDDAQYNIVQ